MATAIENATYRLTNVIELREWDEAAEAYMPIPPESRIACAHCGKLCQKVYEVTREQDGKAFLIGPNCCKKNLFGWEPEKQVARQMEKEAEKVAKNRAHQRLLDLVAPIVAEIAALPIPAIEYKGTKYSSQTPCYGMVGSDTRVLCREGLTEERKRMCLSSWRREQLFLRLASVENTKKRQKLQEIGCCELSVC
jgi:hypothetical protein